MNADPGDRLSGQAPAKVNLFLRVLAREASGYHGIETLLCGITLADDLVVQRTDRAAGVSLDVTGTDTGPVEENLAYRAARMVVDATGRRFGVHLSLAKRIPVGAGLGGGSADAALTLDLVNQLAGNAIPRFELANFAVRLGADVAFLLSRAPLALAWGHGERLFRLPPLPRAPVLLLVPPVAVRTADAYRWVDEARAGTTPRGALLLDAASVSRWSDVARMAGNDFESPVFAREPAVRAGFEALARTHPLLCRMSGSGSTVFAVYRSAAERDDARQMLSRKLGVAIPAETA